MDRATTCEIKTPNAAVYSFSSAIRKKRALRSKRNQRLLRNVCILRSIEREVGIEQVQMRAGSQIGLCIREGEVVAVDVDRDRAVTRYSVSEGQIRIVREIDDGATVRKRHRTVAEGIHAGEIEHCRSGLRAERKVTPPIRIVVGINGELAGIQNQIAGALHRTRNRRAFGSALIDRERPFVDLVAAVENEHAVLINREAAAHIGAVVSVAAAALDRKQRGATQTLRAGDEIAAHGRLASVRILTVQSHGIQGRDFKIAAGTRTGLVIVNGGAERSGFSKNQGLAFDDVNFGEREAKPERVVGRCKTVIESAVRNVAV